MNDQPTIVWGLEPAIWLNGANAVTIESQRTVGGVSAYGRIHPPGPAPCIDAQVSRLREESGTVHRSTRARCRSCDHRRVWREQLGCAVRGQREPNHSRE